MVENVLPAPVVLGAITRQPSGFLTTTPPAGTGGVENH